MKTSAKLFAILCIASAAWAENPVAVSTPAAATAPEVHASTTPPSAVVTGESINTPAPQPLTEPTGGGVFVTLTRTAVPNDALSTNTQIITQEDIRAHNAQTVGEVLKYATSIHVPIEGGQVGSLREAGIRGGSSEQTLVLIDGRPVGGSGLSDSQDLAEIPVEQVDHVEIVRGGASALYGPNALGGVINVITKRATYSGVPISHVSFETGSFDRQATRLDFGSRMGPVDYFFFGDQQRESGFRNNSDARTHNIGGNVGLSMGAGGKLLFDASSYHAEAGVAGFLFPILNPNQFDNEIEKQTETPYAHQVTDTNYLRTSYLLPLPMNSLMTLRAFGSQREATYTDLPDSQNSDRHEQTKGVDAQWSLPLGLLVGGNFLHDRLDSADRITPANNFIASEDSWGVFAQDTMSWKTLSIIPSGRFDHNSTFGDTKNPRVEVIEEATDWLRLSGSAARSFRAPALDELYTPLELFPQPDPFTPGGVDTFTYAGNPGLLPETAWTYDAGFELHEDSVSFKATYFRSNISNLIQLVTSADFLNTTTQNVGIARRQGFELEAKDVCSEYFENRVNYTYLENRGIPPGFDHLVALSLSPRHTVNYIATIKPIKNVIFDNTLKYESSEYEGNDQTSTKIGDHLTWNVRLGYSWRQLELYVGMDDVTNKRYQERAGFPLPGRTTYAGIRLRLWG